MHTLLCSRDNHAVLHGALTMHGRASISKASKVNWNGVVEGDARASPTEEAAYRHLLLAAPVVSAASERLCSQQQVTCRAAMNVKRVSEAVSNDLRF